MTAQFAKDSLSFAAPAAFSPRALAPATVHGFADRAKAALRWVVELPRRRAVLAELNALSDHELADIGLGRGEIDTVFDRSLVASMSLPNARLR